MAEDSKEVPSGLAATTAKTVRLALAPGGWARRFAKLWGFLGFFLLILFLARSIVLPFVFALLLAYILAPAVRWLAVKKGGGKRMPIAAAIVICYIVLLTGLSLFLGALLPRLSKDMARVGREAPALYQRVNDTWTPQVATWLEVRFPSLQTTAAPAPTATPPGDRAMPEGTQLIVTPLPDGRLAIQLEETGLQIDERAEGSYTVAPRKEAPSEQRLEDKLRGMVRDSLVGLQQQVGNVFRLGRAVLTAIAQSIFGFILILMIAAFVLLDIERITNFVRGLFPVGYRGDYDIIATGVNKGLNGVIRGQLIICLVNGVLTWFGLLIFEVKYALLLASVAAVMSLIPIFGSILSTIPIVLSALVSEGNGIDVARGSFILVWIIGIHLLEANFLNPRIIGSAAKMHPVLVIFALVLGEHSYGLTGALLAVPVAAIVQFMFVFFRDKAWKAEKAERAESHAA